MVAVGIWAPLLEERRVAGRPAVAGVAAVIVRPENGAGVLAPAGGPQLGRALPHDVGGAADPAATAGSWAELHGHVEAVHQGDVEEVEVAELVQGVLGQRVGGLPVAAALEETAAVAGLAAPAAGAVEGAAGASPHAAAGGPWVDVDRPGLAGVQPAASAGDGGGPEGVEAPVGDGDGGGLGEGEEEGEEEKEAGEPAKGSHGGEDSLPILACRLLLLAVLPYL